MTVHPVHPSVIDESLFSLVGSRTLSPCAANTTCYCAALHSMLMLFVALKALWGSELAARVRRTASVVPERGGSGVFCSCAPAAVVASGIVNKCCASIEMQQSGFLYGYVWPPLLFLSSALYACFYTLAVLNRKAGQIPLFCFIKPCAQNLWISQWWEAKHGSDAEAESFLTEDNWWNNEFKLSKMEIGFRGGDYHSQWRLKLSKWLGINLLLMLIQVCAIQRVMLIAQNICLRPRRKPQQQGAHNSVEWGSYAHSSGLQNLTKTFNISPTD